MKYYSVAEAAARWHISERRVRALCQEGKVEGALHNGRKWLLPADAAKPADGRS